jgi:hypothetical protein
LLWILLDDSNGASIFGLGSSDRHKLNFLDVLSMATLYTSWLARCRITFLYFLFKRKAIMIKWFYSLFVIVILVASVQASAKAVVKAVNIDVISDGRAVDGNAIRTVRRLSGDALASGVVDVFIVNAPKVGRPIFIEGGLSACAEAGFSSTPVMFNGYINKLRNIHPKVGTTVNVKATDSCIKAPKPQMCGGIAGIACPVGQMCVDDPGDNCDPKKGGADCAGICQTKKPVL